MIKRLVYTSPASQTSILIWGGEIFHFDTAREQYLRIQNLEGELANDIKMRLTTDYLMVQSDFANISHYYNEECPHPPICKNLSCKVSK